MVKLLMNWDIQAGREAEYFQFIIQDFVPGLLKIVLGISGVFMLFFFAYPSPLVSAAAAAAKSLFDAP